MATFPAPFPSDMYSLRFYATGNASANFADHVYPFFHPADDAVPEMAKRRQAWSKGMKIHLAPTAGNWLEYTFDGTNVHGYLNAGEYDIYFERHEGGIAVRGVGEFWIEAW